MDQIELFNHLLIVIIIIDYLKPQCCMQIILITLEYLMNRIINIKNQYVKPSNCILIND